MPANSISTSCTSRSTGRAGGCRFSWAVPSFGCGRHTPAGSQAATARAAGRLTPRHTHVAPSSETGPTCSSTLSGCEQETCRSAVTVSPGRQALAASVRLQATTACAPALSPMDLKCRRLLPPGLCDAREAPQPTAAGRAQGRGARGLWGRCNDCDEQPDTAARVIGHRKKPEAAPPRRRSQMPPSAGSL